MKAKKVDEAARWDKVIDVELSLNVLVDKINVETYDLPDTLYLDGCKILREEGIEI